MARRTITFDSTSLQDDTYQTQEIAHESMDKRLMNFQRLGSKGGAKLINDTFDAKEIKIIGRIKGTSIADLETNIDNLKEVLSKTDKNLDIEYVSGTRRYSDTSCTNLKIIRPFYAVTFADFEAEFTVGNIPHGTTLDFATYDMTSLTIGTYTSNFTFVGTAPPNPIIRCVIAGAASLVKIAFTNLDTNGTITVERTFTSGEVMDIDTENYSVTVDDVAVNYSGFFPEFVQGGNDFKVVFTSESHGVDVKLIYRANYL